MGQQTGQVMTLANSIIGVGILAMPFCFQKCGVLLSIFLLLISNFLTRITCHYLIKSAALTRRRNFEFLAFHAFGFSGKLMVELCIIGYLMGTCVAYFVVVGDLGPQIVSKLFNLTNTDSLRTWIMVIVTLLCVIPLGLLKNVDSLSVVCTVSIGFYFCLVIKVMAESKAHILEGDWYSQIDWWKPSGVLQCLPIFSMALSCQMQLFEVYETIQNASLEHMNNIVKTATNICTCVYVMVGTFGYIAYHSREFSGNILLNFAPSISSDVIIVGFVISVAFSFPLVIFPCRASLYSLLYRRNHSDAANYIPEPRFRWITIVIAFFTMMIGLLIPSIELVIGLVGSTIGVAICIMFPSSSFMKLSKKDSNEKVLSQLVLIFGFTVMILGTYANLNAIDEKASGSHEAINFQKDIVVPTELAFVIADPIKSENIEINLQEPLIETIKKIPEEEQEIKQDVPEDPSINKFPHEENAGEMQNGAVDIGAEDGGGDGGIVDTVRVKEAPQIEKKEEIDENALKKEDHEIAIEKKEEVEHEIEKLKHTKEQLQNEVEEIKKEIVKQSQDSQKLVVEKLEEISKKVEDIVAKNKVVEPETVRTDAVVQLVNNSAANNWVAKNDFKEVPKMETQADVVPESYKIGESISEMRNQSLKLIPSIPLVLANISDIVKPVAPSVDPPTAASIKVEPIPADQDHVDSIRRDILGVAVKLDDENMKTEPQHARDKRQANPENCDLESKQVVEQLLNNAAGGNVFGGAELTGLKIINRNLKSVQDDEVNNGKSNKR